ncbi:hypothetical protein K505DRAFT_293308 [Melanomma pulvis-pyrius CBS 109.77]|uniref:Signal peptide-containing protein n=1 Tax=Melanomma pulvis-pyrius CBS 109.77 TaxID=1314802 RepID=A0A6A6XUA5_9PLEO|nr:hypothetical protein K505DRAFT_293308 [Melanomma pulvis-pyrius CBS 109.77]
MSWLMRGIQSAIFHYASCAPCTGYMYRKQRRKQAKRDREVRRKLQLEQPELYHHPEPTGTNPYWGEEITMGPGPPPRRAKRSNTSSRRGITTAGTHSTQGDRSLDLDPADVLRSSDETADDDNWNRKRYQREDEDLWGLGELIHPAVAGSSVGVTGLMRPGTSKSSAESYYAARNPPVNDLHPPVVSLPSPHPSDNRWMLQPPPKAAVMSGKERAKTDRSRSGSGASSRVELSLQRQVSTRQLQQKIERGETPEMPPISRDSSYSNLVGGQRHDRPRTPQARPISAASSRRKKRRDTAIAHTDGTEPSSGESGEKILRSTSSSKLSTLPNIKVVRVRTSRQQLSTVISSGSGASPPAHQGLDSAAENENSLPMQVRRTMTYSSSTQSSDSFPYLMKHRNPLGSSDISSLNVLQDLVSPRALLNSRFVSAPLMEARIKLPPSDMDEETILSTGKESAWTSSGFGVPFDSFVGERDPRMRWSVDF